MLPIVSVMLLITTQPTYIDMVFKIAAPTLINSKFIAPFKISVSFIIACPDIERSKAHPSPIFSFSSSWKSINTPFEKRWINALVRNQLSRNRVEVIDVKYTIKDKTGHTIIHCDNAQGSYKISPTTYSDVILLIRPTFFEDGRIRLEHEVNFE
jgi:hypothetical protein